VLGPLEVRLGDQVLDLGGARIRTLLALLTANSGRVTTVGTLVAALWGDGEPPAARRSVRTYVSRLRHALADVATDELALDTHAAGYVLRLGPGVVDVGRFEALVAAGRLALAAEPATAAEQLSRALDLWRGDAYGEFADVPLLRAEANRLHGMRLAAIEDRIEADLATGAGTGLAEELTALTEAHPGHDRLWAQLMTALHRAGRQADALDVFVRARGVLVDRFGLDPSPQLVEDCPMLVGCCCDLAHVSGAKTCVVQVGRKISEECDHSLTPGVESGAGHGAEPLSSDGVDAAGDFAHLPEERRPLRTRVLPDAFRAGNSIEHRLEHVVPVDDLVGEVRREHARHHRRDKRHTRILLAHQTLLDAILPRRLGSNTKDDRTILADIDPVGVVVHPAVQFHDRLDGHTRPERPLTHRLDLVGGHRLLERITGAFNRAEFHSSSLTDARVRGVAKGVSSSQVKSRIFGAGIPKSDLSVASQPLGRCRRRVTSPTCPASLVRRTALYPVPAPISWTRVLGVVHRVGRASWRR
jgi:DNA-binding SARP family transcriptional activator